MASLPPRHASQRRSPTQSSETTQSQLERRDSEPVSAVSEDSQTILLNPSHTPAESATVSTPKTEAASVTASPAVVVDDDVRKCWICFNDETEDTPAASEWRSPCPCALVAHEACLLDWVADMEAPTTRRAAGTSKEIRCPQCKAEIHISRQRSLIVDTVRAWDQFSGYLVLPWGLVVVVSAVHSASFLHGAGTIVTIFDKSDSKRILEPLVDAAARLDLKGLLNLVRHHWRLLIGLPSIPWLLIASRTTLGDTILPMLPVFFFATSPGAAEDFRVKWPPSAAFSFASLSIMRGAYNIFYESIWGPWEKQWLKEIQPRVRQNDNPGGEVDPPVDEEDMLEINVDIVEEWEENEQAAQAHADQQRAAEQVAHPLNAPPLDAGNAAEAAADAAPPQRRRREQRGFNLALPSLVDTVLGALVFPGVAAAMGQMLKLTLPGALTTLSPGRKPTGLLQARWARSIVGGCVFVVLKDAMMLYVRWRMAQGHRQRRILNFDKKTKRVIPNAAHARRTFL